MDTTVAMTIAGILCLVSAALAFWARSAFLKAERSWKEAKDLYNAASKTWKVVHNTRESLYDLSHRVLKWSRDPSLTDGGQALLTHLHKEMATSLLNREDNDELIARLELDVQDIVKEHS